MTEGQAVTELEPTLFQLQLDPLTATVGQLAVAINMMGIRVPFEALSQLPGSMQGAFVKVT